MKVSLSVIICTYNPDEFIFSKCLHAIETASLNFAPTEIIIIDNNSTNNFQEKNYLKKFLEKNQYARIIKEEKQGLTPARLKGIQEAHGEILVFVDDDNFVEPDFFKNGIEIALNNPQIGAWSGQVKLVFETEPEPWTKKYWGLLVYREFSINKWSNISQYNETMPCGAGLYVRKSVALFYNNLHQLGKRNIQLDRSVNSLFSAGDNDLAACACDIGFGVGLFKDIIVKHYIPRKRLKLDYLLKLTEGISASAVVFNSFRGDLPKIKTLKNKIACVFRYLLMTNLQKAFAKAHKKGEERGINLLIINE